MHQKKSVQEIYVSTDIETDGPIPGEFSMLSFGSGAFTAGKDLIATFSANIHTLEGARQDPDTMQWWESKPEAWKAARRDLKDPSVAMHEYANWLNLLPGRPVFVGYPASFDFAFINWYLIKFVGENPFSFVALDIKTYATAMLKKPFLNVTKSTMPSRWFDESKKSHVALDDAIEQGWLFCNMFKENTFSSAGNR